MQYKPGAVYRGLYADAKRGLPAPIAFTLPSAVSEVALVCDYYLNAVDPTGLDLKLVLDGNVVDLAQLNRSEKGHQGQLAASLREVGASRPAHTLSVTATGNARYLGYMNLSVLVKSSEAQHFQNPLAY